MVVLWDDPKFVQASEDCNYTLQKGQWLMPKHPKILSKNWWNPRINLSMSEYHKIPTILFHEDLSVVKSWDDLSMSEYPRIPKILSMRVYGWGNPGMILSISEYPRTPRILFHEGL